MNRSSARARMTLGAVMASACALTLLAPAGAQAVNASPPVTPAISDRVLQTKLSALKLPVGPVTGLVTPETLRALCVWRELTGKTATRLAPTDLERAAVLATPTKTTWRVPTTIKSVRFAVNMQCQTAMFITHGVVVRVFPVSTGRLRGWTRRGLFRVYWIYPRRWQASSLFPEPDGRPGLFRPIYFDGNIAVHGTRHTLRTIPESHGCIRTRKPDQRWIAKRLKLGMKVWVYGSYWKAAVDPFGLKPTSPIPVVTSRRSLRAPQPIG